MFLWNIAVTSLAEVWIEIVLLYHLQRPMRSLPLRKCGLKFIRPVHESFIRMSLPLRKCGLKYDPYNWMSDRYPSLPLRKCGLKYYIVSTSLPESYVTSLAEVWIEIAERLKSLGKKLSLPLRKCGLKYGKDGESSTARKVTSLAEVWIEISLVISHHSISLVTSLAEVWIEIERDCQTIRRTLCHFPCGSVD